MSKQIEIRQFIPDEAGIAAYRKIRSEALETNPEAFMTTADGFAKRTDHQVELRLKANFASPDQLMIGAFDGDDPVGMMGLIRSSYTKQAHVAHIIAVFVSVSHRKHGLGGRMIDHLIEFARSRDGLRQVHLGVISANTAAIALYRSRGFERYGCEPRALLEGDRYYDEDLMVKFLDDYAINTP